MSIVYQAISLIKTKRYFSYCVQFEKFVRYTNFWYI